MLRESRNMGELSFLFVGFAFRTTKLNYNKNEINDKIKITICFTLSLSSCRPYIFERFMEDRLVRQNTHSFSLNF